ncbi:DNA glycosylase [Spinellus fusiger]|nr:DNA glycosylase [Spinellus fusiger]
MEQASRTSRLGSRKRTTDKPSKNNTNIETSSVDEIVAIEESVDSRRLFHEASYHQITSKEKNTLPDQLLEWFDREKRLTMPWRKVFQSDLDIKALGQRAYEATVIEYYNRWMDAFPTIYDLAKSDIEKVNTLWAGLGYYSRARRLWEGAQKVVTEFDGVLPNDPKELEHHIPGVGRYTAGAVASIAFGKQTPVVDGNVVRVLSRLRAIEADFKKASVVDLYWQIAGSLVPKDRPGDFNQAMMELGARVCVPQNPLCSECPLSAHCRALAQSKVAAQKTKEEFWSKQKRKKGEHGCPTCPEILVDLESEDYQVTRYPFKSAKKPPKDEECGVSIVEWRQLGKEPLFLISKRPDTGKSFFFFFNAGLLAGLWEFPTLELSGETDYKERSEKATVFLKECYSIDLAHVNQLERKDLSNVIHLFSHIRKVYHIEHVSYQTKKEDTKSHLNTTTTIRWVTLEELKKAAIPTGLKKAFKLLEAHKVDPIVSFIYLFYDENLLTHECYLNALLKGP